MAQLIVPSSVTGFLSTNRLSLWIGLPGIVLASLLGGTQSLAATQAQGQTDSSQAELVMVTGFADSSPSEPTLVADVFDTIRDINRGVRAVDRALEPIQRQQEQERREAARQKRLREEEAARAAAAAQRQLEAQRQREYFESLSPEEQQAYLEQQRVQQEAQTLLMIGILELMFSDSPSSSNQDNDPYDDPCHLNRKACRTFPNEPL